MAEFVNVSTQKELEAALKEGNIPVCRGNGTFVVTEACDSATVRACDSATVEAWGSATVEAWGSATVRAWGSATVEAWGSATVRACDSATVRAWGSATVRACDSATVRAWGSATVRAWGSATVEAWGSATVEAWGSATVRAWGSATVRAWGSATVRAWGSATVQAQPYVAVHRHGEGPKVNGGVLIQVPECRTVEEFIEFYGVQVKRGKATLFKLVDDDFKSRYGTVYEPGGKAEASDWDARPSCGGGLHFSPRPFMARKYSNGSRYVACEVPVKDLVVIPSGGGLPADKAKGKSCKVLHEVTADGDPVAAVEKAAA